MKQQVKKKYIQIFTINNGNMIQYLLTVLFGFLVIAKNLTMLEILSFGMVENLLRANDKLLPSSKYPIAET